MESTPKSTFSVAVRFPGVQAEALAGAAHKVLECDLSSGVT